MKARLHYESLTVPLRSTDQLHITRLFRDIKKPGAPVLMIHDVAQDGRTFYRSDGSGLAGYLARQGFDVYVADLRGRGRSWPKVNHNTNWRMHDVITQDIPALVNKVVAKRGPTPQIWIGHGWGGLLLSACYARGRDTLPPVARLVQFGVRRRLTRRPLPQWFVLQVMWAGCSRLLARLNGYWPAPSLGLGRCDEATGMLRDALVWQRSADWRDPVDEFDYAAALQGQAPPSIYIASSGDRRHATVDQVRHFMQTLGPHDSRLLILGRAAGSLHNYDHFAMLGHADCDQDHFPLLLQWLREK